MSIPKKEIPAPAEVPAQHHEKVLHHVVEQYGAKHYQVKYGSIVQGETTLNPETGLNETPFSFVRTDDPKVTPEPHGLDLS